MACRWRVQGEQSAQERSGLGLLQVDVARFFALKEIPDRIVRSRFVKTQQNVIVTVKSGYRFRHGITVNSGDSRASMRVTMPKAAMARKINFDMGRCFSGNARTPACGVRTAFLVVCPTFLDTARQMRKVTRGFPTPGVPLRCCNHSR